MNMIWNAAEIALNFPELQLMPKTPVMILASFKLTSLKKKVGKTGRNQNVQPEQIYLCMVWH